MFLKNINNVENQNQNKTLFYDFFSSPNNPEELFTPLYLLHKSEKCETYKAIYNETQEIFCIKKLFLEKIFKEKNSSKYFYNKMKEETSLIKNLNHNNILKYHGSFFSFEMKAIYLIYEYLEGGSVLDLGKILDRNFTEEEIALIINDILHGLIYLHQLNIINRNIKMSNILLSNNGNAKIGNFEKTIHKLNNNNEDEEETYNPKYDILLISITCIEMIIGLKNEFNRDKFIKQILNNKSVNLNMLLENELNKNSKKISPEFKSFLIQCLDPYPFKRPTAFELINHSFIKNNINEINKNNFSFLVKNNIEKLENYKAMFYKKEKRSFYNSIQSNNRNTLKNKSFDNELNVDKLAEFRIEQMKKNEIIEYDKYTEKDVYSNNEYSSVFNNEKKENNFFEKEEENNLDNIIIKESDDLDFKSKWEHVKKYQNKLIPKFSENNINYNYNSHILKFDAQDDESENYDVIKKSEKKIDYNLKADISFNGYKCDIIKLNNDIKQKSSKKINDSSSFSLKNNIIPKNKENKKLILSMRNTIAFTNDTENKISNNSNNNSFNHKNNIFEIIFDKRKTYTPFKYKKNDLEEKNMFNSDRYFRKEYLYQLLDDSFDNQKINNDIKKCKSTVIKVKKLLKNQNN